MDLIDELRQNAAVWNKHTFVGLAISKLELRAADALASRSGDASLIKELRDEAARLDNEYTAELLNKAADALNGQSTNSEGK
jgi:hypothetical protein